LGINLLLLSDRSDDCAGSMMKVVLAFLKIQRVAEL
jgi:hypothetical protein